MLAICLIILLNELPCATTATYFPLKIAGQIVSFQKGIVLATLSFKHSPKGSADLGNKAYLGSLIGFD